MPEPKPFPEMIEDRYGDRGGWKGLGAIFSGQLPYEDKMQEVKDCYRVSLVTARKWYTLWRKMGM